VADSVEELFESYAARYSEGDLQGVASLCVTPFVAVRRGEVMVLADRGEVLSHFAAAIDAYRRAANARTWSPREIETKALGDYSAFATVHWNATDDEGTVVRDTSTSYQLLATPDGWRLMSYTNHF
jgi:hypothetical protein